MAFVDSQASAGSYKSADEYVISLLSRVRSENDQLDAMLIEGLDSGGSMPLDEAAWQSIREEVNQALRK